MKRALYLSLIVAILSIFHCGKSDKSQADNKKTETKIETRYVSAKGGLRMRDKPDITGNKSGTIPTGTKVSLLEETGKDITIAGATGKWSKVKWGDKKGWVFGGFLKNSKPRNCSWSTLEFIKSETWLTDKMVNFYKSCVAELKDYPTNRQKEIIMETGSGYKPRHLVTIFDNCFLM